MVDGLRLKFWLIRVKHLQFWRACSVFGWRSGFIRYVFMQLRLWLETLLLKVGSHRAKTEGVECKREKKILRGVCSPISECTAASCLHVYLSASDAQHAVVTFRSPAFLHLHQPPSLLTLLPAFVLGSTRFLSVHGRFITAVVKYTFRLFLHFLWPCFGFVSLHFDGGCLFWDSRLLVCLFFFHLQGTREAFSGVW